ncbi:SMP-30/gluconolactonase/LRE family protein [Vibrio sp. HN007]|uniref:SMP-30/gluconolactonase/LRE family protein n=1 Tax=Vibrio iocasae TaxID=3098914 RepID=UPI0035D4A7F5
MRSTLTSALLGLSLFFTNTSLATSLSPQWELSGFSGPESVYVSPDHPWIYVTNINGEKEGFISKLSKTGQIDQMKWVEGLGMPTGMGMFENNLYVVDGKQVHVIDVETGKVHQSIEAKDAAMLNDLTISEAGQVFVGDIAAGKIYTIIDNELVVWLEDKNLPHPNGLLAQGNTLIAANLASKLAQQFKPEEFGSVYKIDLVSKSVSLMNSSYRLGGLDGVTELNGTLVVSHFPAGEIYQITDNERILLGKVDASAADISIDDSSDTLFIPFLFNGKVAAYKIIND